MKLYDKVKQLLESEPYLRNSDKELAWAIWTWEGLTNESSIHKHSFLIATPMESITRARRKVQENHPALAPTNQVVKNQRKTREAKKGNFVYQENVKPKFPWED